MIKSVPLESRDHTSIARLVIDGREDEQGRALHLISSLHLCGSRLREVSIDIVGATAPVVPVAALALGYDTGADVRLLAEDEGESALVGASLFASVTLDHAEHALLTAAASRAVPTIVAVQFPRRSEGLTQTINLARAAHDTRQMAELLAARLWK